MRRKSRTAGLALAAGIAVVLSPVSSGAFKLRPTGTEDEQIIVKLEGGIISKYWSEVKRNARCLDLRGVIGVARTSGSHLCSSVFCVKRT